MDNYQERRGRGRGLRLEDRPCRARGRGRSLPARDPPAALQAEVQSFREVQMVAPRYANLLRDDDDPETNEIAKPLALCAKKGFSGTSIPLTANYFSLQTNWSWSVNIYNVYFHPTIELTTEKKALLRSHESAIGQSYVFDGSLLYVRNVLHPSTIFYSAGKSDATRITITFEKIGCFDSDNESHNIQLFNIIMRTFLEELKLKQVGRNYYDPHDSIEIPRYCLDLWPGYITSIRQHDASILICMEVCHKVMRRDTAFTLYQKCLSDNPDEWQGIFARAIIGTIVLTDFNNRTYRIDDVDFSYNPSSTFQLKKGEMITFAQYYLDRYNINVGDLNQPMLVHKTKKKLVRHGMSPFIYLPPSLCRLTGITDDMRADFNMMKSLSEHTRLSPERRVQKLIQCNRRLLENPVVEHDLSRWNLSLSNSLVKIEGRVLPTESIQFGQNCLQSAMQSSEWSYFKGVKMYSPVCMDNWAVVFIERDRHLVNSFIQFIMKASPSLGVNISPPIQAPISVDKIDCWTQTLDDTVTRSSPSMIMCIVPNGNPFRYAAIKKRCCIDRPVPSQVILLRNLRSKALPSICTKLVIQMNCKLGGAPWTLHVPCHDLMVIGYDVYHDAQQKNRSCSAFVASLNPSFTAFHSSTTRHSNGEELSNDIHINILTAMEKFKRINNRLPKFIVVYRDGVSDGQMSFVVEHEAKLVEKVLNDHFKEKAPRISFIIVSKRLNTRIFHENKNPPPGTVVDDAITLFGQYDFFLVSQSVRQGTVSPTSYQIVYDTINWGPDIYQRLSYKLTHLYFNWPGTVRVPAPVQYAHKLAFLVGHFLKGARPSPCLDELLFYL